MSQYSEKLRDPRWQKFRLKILERDNWTCQRCFANEYTLVVHHRYYLPNIDPWDYEQPALVTLCENCHEIEHTYLPISEKAILIALKRTGAYSDQLNAIVEAFFPSCCSGKIFNEQEWSQIADSIKKTIKEIDKSKTADL